MVHLALQRTQIRQGVACAESEDDMITQCELLTKPGH